MWLNKITEFIIIFDKSWQNLIGKFIILFKLMLPPNNNYYPYQGPPATNNYTFDLKLNVDFNNGRVGLGLPHNSPPFQKNHQVPLVYTEPSHVTPVSSYQVPIQRNKPVIHQIPSVWQPVPQ